MYQIAHIGVRVKDVDKSAAFYQDILECEIAMKHEDERVKIIFVKCGDNVIELIQNKQQSETRSTGVVDHIAFRVDNLEPHIEKLKQNKVQCISQAPRAFNGGRIFFFAGPDGEILEFVEA